MTNQLPNDVRTGDQTSIQPDVLTHGASAEVMPKDLVGTVISIPPHRRFAVVRYNRQGGCFCESIPIAPPEERVVKKPEGSSKPVKPLTQRLQERDWSSMTSVQIAEVLDTSAHAITSAIYNLAKRGIIIPYKKMVGGRPEKRKEGQNDESM